MPELICVRPFPVVCLSGSSSVISQEASSTQRMQVIHVVLYLIHLLFNCPTSSNTLCCCCCRWTVFTGFRLTREFSWVHLLASTLASYCISRIATVYGQRTCYHFVISCRKWTTILSFSRQDPNEDTEWNDILRKKGILPPKETPKEDEEEELALQEQSVGKKPVIHVSKNGSKTLHLINI